jgi:DNA-binding beta-propeller fold protein YncE
MVKPFSYLPVLLLIILAGTALGVQEYAIGHTYYMDDISVSFPMAVIPDADGSTFWILDKSDGIVHVSAEGKLLGRICTYDPDHPQSRLEYASDFFFDKALGRILITESRHNKVVIFDDKGHFLDSFGKAGFDTGEFDEPRGIVADGEGNIYVADYNNHRVQAFDRFGRFLRQMGSLGMEPGKLRRPEGLAIAGDGTLWVADSFNTRISHFGRDGTVIGVMGDATLMDQPWGVDAGQNGMIYVADHNGNAVLVMTEAGEIMSRFGDDDEERGMLAPRRVAVDGQGRVYVTCFATQTVLRYDPIVE